jgi:hypothetical protein
MDSKEIIHIFAWIFTSKNIKFSMLFFFYVKSKA